MPTTASFSTGWVGVEIFFVLSGFVIAYSTEGATPRRFVRHRFRRLFPAALICASTTCLFRTAVAYPWQQTSREWLRSVTFFPVGPWVDGSYWTLSVEIAFYLLVLFTLVGTRGRYLASLMAAVGTVSALSCLVLLEGPTWMPLPVLRFLAACWFPPMACTLFVYGTFFALGVYLFPILVQGFSWRRGWIALICILGCLAEIGWHERGSASAGQRQMNWLLPATVWSLAVVLLVISVLYNTQIQGLLSDRWRARARLAGLLTYPLYLLHGNIGQWLVRGLYRRIGYGASITLVITAMLGAAAFITIRIEPRLLRFIDKLQESH